tara:strand:+ start:355 stop:1161 length:807 start_codon:yes stop_codon:yes gene_type:complete
MNANRSIISLIFFSLIVIVCVITNPDREIHAQEIKELLSKEMTLSNGFIKDSNEFEALGLSIAMSLVEKLIETMIVVDNYVLFSTTKIEVQGERKIIGYGILGNVFIFDSVKEVMRSSIDDINSSILDVPKEVTLWGRNYPTTEKTLQRRDLKGKIPTDICKLKNLKHLALYGELSGEIPSCIGDLTNLKFLSIAGNQLTGEIPSSIGNLTNLTELRLHNNQLTGEIPSEICNQGHSAPDLGNNKLCPPYPPCIQQWIIDSQDTSECE